MSMYLNRMQSFIKIQYSHKLIFCYYEYKNTKIRSSKNILHNTLYFMSQYVKINCKISYEVSINSQHFYT